MTRAGFEPEPIYTDPPAHFELNLFFKSGLARTFVMSAFDWDEHSVRWRQDTAGPGEELLKFVNWDEVLLITTNTIEPRAPRRRG